LFLITGGSSSWKISEQPLTVNSQDVDQAANNPITSYSNIAYTLRFYAGTHFQSLRSYDGKEYEAIGIGLDTTIFSDEYSKYGEFTGSFVGLTCADRVKHQQYADFDFFEYNVDEMNE
jgi:beta-xylosidase